MTRHGMIWDEPPGWNAVFQSGELEQAYRLLEGQDHFYSWSLRGRIRSIGLDDRADDLFDRASDLVETAPPGHIRHVIAHAAFTREHSIVQGYSHRYEKPEELLRFPTAFRACIETHLALYALEALNQGQSQLAVESFNALIRRMPRDRLPSCALWQAARGAALMNLGRSEAGKRALEDAGLYSKMLGSQLGAGRIAAILWAVYTEIGEKREALGWLRFLQKMELPRATRDILRKRAAFLRVRTAQAGRLVVV
jgi:hypothetical protein